MVAILGHCGKYRCSYFSLIFPSLAFAKLICTTTYPSAPEDKAYYLEEVTIFVQHYIMLFGIVGCVLVCLTT